MTTVRTEPSKIGKEEGTKLGAYTQQRSLVHYAADKGGGALRMMKEMRMMKEVIIWL